METLQRMVENTLPPMTRQNLSAKEAYRDAEDGSPLPGETASPQSYSQHSPSLPVSGLTEFSNVYSASWDTSLEKPSELPALKGLISDTSQKQYLGVRVKMPVRELLRKIRLSEGISSNNAKDMSVKAGTKKMSGTAEKKRAYSGKRHKQNSHHNQVALKSGEELDMLVEVLQEDLNKSQSKLGLQLSMPYDQGPSPEHQHPWREGVGNPQPENSWEPLRFQPRSSLPSSDTLLHPYAENCHGFDGRMMQGFPDPNSIFQNSCEEGRSWQRDCAVEHSGESFQGLVENNPPGNVGSEPLEDHAITLNDGRIQKPSIGSFWGQDVPAISFFQFQLHREETQLRNIPAEKLLAPDNHGNRQVLQKPSVLHNKQVADFCRSVNECLISHFSRKRLLHVAVTQGRRALAYALAWRFAHMNRIDEKDAAKQTALHIAAQKNYHLIVGDLAALGANINARNISGKTPLHLCAEKGCVAVLEVLKNCLQSGTHVEVDATDNQGLTPLQSGALAHIALVKDLGNRDLSREVQQVLALRKDRVFRGLHCLMEMGADPWVQGTKSSDEASHYFTKLQENKELMNFFQIYRPRWPEDTDSPQRGEAGTLQYLQAEEEMESPAVSFSSLLDYFLESAMSTGDSVDAK